MKEQFIPYKLALELKELGFNESCMGFYYDFGKKLKQTIKIKNSMAVAKVSETLSTVFVAAPLWQQAFDWFRDKEIPSWIEIYNGERIHYEFNINPNGKYLISSEEFKTYEEARQVCLEKLIKLCKNK